jgi:hypothetical protein
MHVQHLAVDVDGWCRALLVIVRLLEDGKGIGGSALFEFHIHDDVDVDKGMVCCVCWKTVKTKVNGRILDLDLVA